MTLVENYSTYTLRNGRSIPAGCARGGKAGKGSGGSVGSYNGLSNSSAPVMTWEDMVLAMQLTAMCFGALFAVCVVGCCAYKICGPAEEVEWGSQYSVLKPPRRQPPEILREIYTVPASSANVSAGTAAVKEKAAAPSGAFAAASVGATPPTPTSPGAPASPLLPPPTPTTPKTPSASSPRPTWKVAGATSAPTEDGSK
ncbi:hypothetical protein SK128_002729 [Halocaridina rubra]|uniref:Uncharacterized protein n=1 Tax=Halocaridina rubra TaxID=373956 RepID=A0AAN8WMJ2_HALRR